MKRILSIILLTVMLLQTAAFADTLDATTHTKTNNILIKGQITDTTITANNNILSIYLIKNGASLSDALTDYTKIGHIGQVKINHDGTYLYKFNFDKQELSDYSLHIKAGDNDVTDSITITEVNGEILNVDINILRSVITDGITSSEKIEANTDVLNLYGDAGEKYKIIVAFYDGDKRLISAFVDENLSTDYISGKYLFKSTVPQNARDIKIFALNQITTAPLGNVAISSRNADKMFRDGDVVAFVGDSITHNGNIVKFIESYLYTRYPGETITLRNKGINMDTGAYIKSRLDWNILSENPNKVSLMFGMNDCGQVGTSSRQDMINRTNTCFDYWKSITNTLTDKGIEVYCATPTIRDNYENPNTTVATEPITSDYGLSPLSDRIRTLAKEKDYKIIDLNYYTDETTKVTAPQNHIVGTDRIHPDTTGYFAIASYYLYELGATSTVASVMIDASAQKADTDNADISNLYTTENGVTYTYSPKSLPIAYNAEYQTVMDKGFFDIDGVLNNESIKVSGLSEDDYKITIDGELIGIYSGKELSQGINIATNQNNPNQKIAKQIYNLLENKRKQEYYYQQNWAKWIERFDLVGKAYIENNKNSTDPVVLDAVKRFETAGGMPYNYDFTSAEFNTPNTTITHPTTGAVINTTYNPDSQYIKDIKLLYPGRREYDYANEFWNEFVTGAQNKDIYINNIKANEEKARELAKPLTSRVVIQKVDLTEPGNLVSFGLDKEYKEIPYDATTKERFLLRRAELPEEIPVVKYKTPKGKYELYVSNDGSDENKGTIEKPFKTLAHAVNVAKITPNSEGIAIYLREGVYEFLSTEIIKGLKGNADNPIFVSAYPGEEVKFGAAYKLDNSQFKPVTDSALLSKLDKNIRDKIRVIDLKEQGIDYVPAINGQQMGSALFMDGNTFNIARYPNIGYAKVEQVIDEGPVQFINEQINPDYYNDGRGFTIGLVNDKEPLSWKDTGDIWVRGGFRYEWYQVYTPIKIDYENSSFNSRGAESVHGVKAGSDFWYYNVFEELNFPGEYYIDRNEMKLYLYPIGDIKSSSNIFLSVATGSLMNVTDCKNLIISDINFEAGTKEAVVLNDCEDVVFQRCNFQNFGSNQAVFKTSKRCGFTSCKFVEFGDRAFHTGTGMNIDKIEPFNNFIQNCAINGNKDQILHSMTSFSGVGEIASHNLYTNGYATGAGTGGWEGIVEYNEFVASPKYQLDSGGTYGGGTTGVRGYHIRYNYIHDILPNSISQLTRGIYVDVMGSDTLIYGNIMYKIPAGIFAHGGRDHTYFNNISVALNSPSSFAASNSLNMFNPDPSATMLSRTQYIRPTEAIKSRFPNYYKWLLVRNKVADDFNNADGNYVRGDEWNEVFAPINFYYANNVSALGGGKFIYSTSVDWDQTEGLNTNFTTNNDPFVDLENRNFNIRKDADIYTAIPDFVAPDFDNMGLLIGRDYMLEKPKMSDYGDIFAFSPADGDMGTHNASKVEFMWTDVIWSNRYRLEIAKDKDFNNVVYDKTIEYEYETITNLQPNTTYYWRVTATTLSKSVDPTPLYSKVFTFTTAK